MRSARVTAAAILCAIAWGAIASPAAGAAKIYTYDAGAPVQRPTRPRRDARASDGQQASQPPEQARSPSGPPLVSTSNTNAGVSESALATSDASSSAPASGGDPLVENGLGSPMCGAGAGELSPASRRNCLTSGFEAAGAPTGNYGLDVHIDTGAIGFTAATLEQDYLIEPVWMSLVWMVHTLVVALEWCFTLDLLDSSAMGGVERALRETQAAFTRPWLVLALALGSLVAAYNGLVRRRVAETLGEAALMLAMMAGGLWVIADPTGTVGALGQWVDEASLGTLGAVVQGTPAQAPRTLADSLSGLFAGVIGGPWCYLEFGNVRWCAEPALLDRRLRAAGLRIAAGARAADGCGSGQTSEQVCQVLEGEQARARAQSATLLLAARTNGELFLALPANQAARNSINDRSSLLSVLCGGSEDATNCHGSTASQAEFRTQGGTTARVGGLLLIAIGALGAILLLGFIALHLLGAEIVSLLYLLLAPAAVIAPALGEGGRAVFRAWGMRLLGAVISKLLFSFLLGVVLLLTRTMMDLSALGWWTRWLLVTTIWWGSYRQRHRAIGFAQGEHLGRGAHRQSLARRIKDRFETPRMVWQGVQMVRNKRSRPAPNVEPPQTPKRTREKRVLRKANEQAERMLEHQHREAREHVAGASTIEARLSSGRAQLQRVRAAQGEAAAAGDTRGAARLGVRRQRIEHEVAHMRETLNTSWQAVAVGERLQRQTGLRYTSADVEERERFLDAQAALPAGIRTRSAGGEQLRDYATLASLVGYGREQYERLDPQRRRAARLKIDRELALRRELNAAGDQRSSDVTRRSTPPPSERLPSGRPHDGRSHGRMYDARLQAGTAGRESAVMRDAHEVARRRKRQLGE
jgi:hypothetical protein